MDGMGLDFCLEGGTEMTEPEKRTQISSKKDDVYVTYPFRGWRYTREVERFDPEKWELESDT